MANMLKKKIKNSYRSFQNLRFGNLKPNFIANKVFLSGKGIFFEIYCKGGG